MRDARNARLEPSLLLLSDSVNRSREEWARRYSASTGYVLILFVFLAITDTTARIFEAHSHSRTIRRGAYVWQSTSQKAIFVFEMSLCIRTPGYSYPYPALR